MLTTPIVISVNMLKFPAKKFGLLPECNLTNTPWYEVAVNLIGPWTAKTDQFNGEFCALTCIDTTTNLIDLTPVDTNSSDSIAIKFENTWLAQCQRPAQVPMIMVANSQGMPLPASLVFWESKTFPQSVRIYSLMLYVNARIRQWQQCWRHSFYHALHKHPKMSCI